MLEWLNEMAGSVTEPEHAYRFTIFSLISGWFWTCAYLLAIWNGFKYKTYCVPAPAICMNLAWELLGALNVSDYAPVWVWLCRLAVVLDSIIFLTAMLYGAKQQRPWLSNENIFRTLMLLGLVFMCGIQYLHIHSLDGLSLIDESPNPQLVSKVRYLSMADTYIINLLMSIMFLTWFFEQHGPFDRKRDPRFSLSVAIFKMLGTAITLGPVMQLDGQHFTIDMKAYLISMAMTCVAVDVAYIVFVAKMQVGVLAQPTEDRLGHVGKEAMAAGQP